MTEFLLSHTNFAIWAFLYLLGGLVLTAVWTWSFRRLARVSTDPVDLFWEARRGAAGGVIWLAMLALIFSLMVTTADINAVSAVAASDQVSDLLLQSIARDRSIVRAPAAGIFGIALLAMLAAGVYSGAWRVLRTGPANRTGVVDHA